jgi:hypothetical protein
VRAAFFVMWSIVPKPLPTQTVGYL